MCSFDRYNTETYTMNINKKLDEPFSILRFLYPPGSSLMEPQERLRRTHHRHPSAQNGALSSALRRRQLEARHAPITHSGLKRSESDAGKPQHRLDDSVRTLIAP